MIPTKKLSALLATRAELDASLSNKLRKSILQQAIRGLLVEQDPNDEPAIDLLKRVNPNATPSTEIENETLPNGWCAVTLKDICKVISAKPFQIQQKQIQEIGKYPVVSQSANYIEGYSDIECVFRINKPIIVFGDHTRNVKYIDFDFVVGADGTKILEPYIYPKYAYLLVLFASQNIRNRGYSRHFSYLSKVILPLPPLNEQKRIVAKVEELFAVIDGMNN